MRLIKWALLAVSLGALISALPALAFAEEEADRYGIFYSEPSRVDALFVAMLDAMPYSSIEELAADRPEVGSDDMWNGRWSNGVLPDLDALEEMEDEFGDMPEYWQLRYVAGGGKFLWDRVHHLKRATLAAPDDAASLYLYARHLYRGTKYTGPGGEAVEYSGIEQYRRKRERAEMMERAAKMNGQNAYYYSEAGEAWSYLGEYPHVMELFERGNWCLQNEKVNLFPFSYIARNLDKIPKRFPDRYLLATMSGYFLERPDYIRSRTMVKEIVTIVSLSGNLDYITTTHRWACRMGARDHASLLDRLVARTLTSIIASAMLDLGYDPEGVGANRGFSRLAHYRGTINGIAFGWTKRDVLSGRDPVEEADAVVGDVDAFKLVLEQRWENNRAEAEIFGPGMAMHFEWMEAFDFDDPAAFMDAKPNTMNKLREEEAAQAE
jgi:hypothetical protein